MWRISFDLGTNFQIKRTKNMPTVLVARTRSAESKMCENLHESGFFWRPIEQSHPKTERHCRSKQRRFGYSGLLANSI